MKKQQNNKPPLFSAKYFVHDLARVTAGLPGLLWFRPRRIYSCENAKERIRGGALLISNHIGFFDPMYMMMAVWYRRHRFICGKDLYTSRGGFMLKAFLCLPIDKYNPDINSFKEITKHLSQGELVSMFPEGYIQTDGKMSDFKSGMALMALKSGKPIVPMYICRRKSFFSRLTVIIGEKVDITRMSPDKPVFAKIAEATALLRQREEELEKIARTQGG